MLQLASMAGTQLSTNSCPVLAVHRSSSHRKHSVKCVDALSWRASSVGPSVSCDNGGAAPKSSPEVNVDRRNILMAGISILAVKNELVSDEARAAVLPNSDQPSNGPKITRKLFLDVSIDGAPAGRIVIGVFEEDVPVGAARFAELAEGRKGVSFRRNNFVKVLPTHILHSGVRGFNISGTSAGAADFTGGDSADQIAEELQKVNRSGGAHLSNLRGSVSLVAIDPFLPPPTTKLVARNGALVTVEEYPRPPPNGTEFAIITKDVPELDATNLVVGRVLDGWDTVDAISGLRTVKENSSSPYFQVAKQVGDKRAVIAERGFNRPYAKVVVTKCGQLI